MQQNAGTSDLRSVRYRCEGIPQSGVLATDQRLALRLIALIYPTFTDNSELIHEIHKRADAFADAVIIGQHVKFEDNWLQMEREAMPLPGDYIFVMDDTDYIDDVSSLRRWLLLNNHSAYACMRYSMYKDNTYRSTGKFRPKFVYQIFPYKKKATLHNGIPSYTYNLPYINDPHLTVLSFRHYDKQNETQVTTEKWNNPITTTAAKA
jgi:hypothetical protein